MRPIFPTLIAGVFSVATAAMAAEPPKRDDASAAPPPALSSQDLAQVDGRQGPDTLLLSEQQLDAISSGNTISAGTVRSGDIAFSTNALAGFSGVGNFVVNTGNNNVLQGAISVSIITTPSP